MNNRTLLIALLGLIVVIGGLSAGVMISASTYMNRAADYVAARPADLPAPAPLIASQCDFAAPLNVESVARYGALVEVQITRRCTSPLSGEQWFTITRFYEPQGEAWALVPAPQSFWGETKTTTGTYVAIVHPQRTARLAENLKTVADTALEAACARWACPPALFPLTLTFTPEAVMAASALQYPAPQLSGVPMNRQANTDYLGHIAADALVTVGETIGGQNTFARALAEREIVRQGLYAQAADPAVFAADFRATQSHLPLAQAWYYGQASEAASFVAYLIETRGLTDWQALAALGQSDNFADWMTTLGLDPAQTEADWLASLP